jgi:hypothetical protein
MKKQPFDLKVAATRWLIGILIGLGTAVLAQLQVPGTMLGDIRWEETLTTVIATFITSALVDLAAWKNFPAPTDETE